MKGRFGKQLDLLRYFCRSMGLHRSGVREMILLKFLAAEHHVTAHDFWERLRRGHRSLDLKTVQSALDLLVGAGLARELRLEDGSLIYEHAFAHRHHDHLICRRCGGMIEFQNPAIEKLQEEVAAQHGFAAEDHTLSLYGVCKSCASKAGTTGETKVGVKESLVALSDLEPGQKGVVRHIDGGEGMRRQMAAMNIRPGKMVTKVSAMLMGGPVVVSVDGRQLAIGHGMAKRVKLGVPWA